MLHELQELLERMWIPYMTWTTREQDYKELSEMRIAGGEMVAEQDARQQGREAKHVDGEEVASQTSLEGMKCCKNMTKQNKHTPRELMTHFEASDHLSSLTSP